MTKTKTHGLPTTLPGVSDIDVVEKAMAAAFNAVEDVEIRTSRIVGQWLDAGEAIDRPTFETLGVLTELVDVVESELEAIREDVEKIKTNAHQLMTMRAELALRQGGRDAS